MPKAPKFDIKVMPNGLFYIYIPDKMSPSGNGGKRYFKRKADALDAQAELKRRLKKHGEGAPLLEKSTQDAVTAILEQIAPYGVSLAQVVSEWCATRRAEKGETVGFVLREYIEQFRGRSQEYTRTVKRLADRLGEDHGEVYVNDFTPAMYRVWLEKIARTDRAFNKALRSISPAFTWAVEQRFAVLNPSDGIRQRKLVSDGIQVLSVEQARKVFECCRDWRGNSALDKNWQVDCRDCVVPFALLLFAGIRPMELTRLNWNDVSLSKSHIYVSPKVSKTSDVRLVRIEDNLMSVLNAVPKSQRYGGLVPSNWKRKVQAVRQMAGIDEMQDVCRHSYASYWLAMWKDMNLLMENMGHSTRQVTLKHYRAAVEKIDAEEYWKIAPCQNIDENPSLQEA